MDIPECIWSTLVVHVVLWMALVCNIVHYLSGIATIMNILCMVKQKKRELSYPGVCLKNL